MRVLLFLGLATGFAAAAAAQSEACVLQPPFFRLHFGKGQVQDVNVKPPDLYERLSTSCPTDGYYAFVSATSECFHGDWHTLTEDHTPGDAGGNMLLVNSAYSGGQFLSTRVKGFKGGSTYRFGVWLMNLCRPTRKCPYPLLPDIVVRLQTPAGKTVAQFSTGELTRVEEPQWKEYKGQFTFPPAETELLLTLLNNAPGGCGNDFALDDISFSECIPPKPPKPVETKKIIPVLVKKEPPLAKSPAKKPVADPAKRRDPVAPVGTNRKSFAAKEPPAAAPGPVADRPAPLILKQRTNTVVRRIETTAGEIRLDLYDNGEIDGDTVSIYHNNQLIASEQRLSQKPISLRIQVDKDQPYHELVMVANNLGSIPPNTSLMIVTTRDNRYQVFISSNEQQNAKLVIRLKD